MSRDSFQEKTGSFIFEEYEEEEKVITTKIKKKKKVTFSPSVLDGMHGPQTNSDDVIINEKHVSDNSLTSANQEKRRTENNIENSSICVLL